MKIESYACNAMASKTRDKKSGEERVRRYGYVDKGQCDSHHWGYSRYDVICDTSCAPLFDTIF